MSGGAARGRSTREGHSQGEPGAVEPLVDGYGRVHRDLRISVTDRCNFRCTYCMPAEGMTWLPRSEVLTFEEIERVARVCVEQLGVDSIRLTGGEPTVRALAPDLAGAGLRRINVSLDTLRPDRFADLTRRDQLDAVLDGIDAAVEAGLDPVKVNTVVMRGVNDDEIVDLAAFGRTRGVTVRFIEWMPLDADGRWGRQAVVGQDEIVAAVDAVFPLEPVVRGHEPAERFAYRDGGGEIGVIPSVTRPFCASCDRIRLTADGQLRACLFAVDEVDLRAVLRSGGSDGELAATVRACVRGKWAGHMIGQTTFIRPRRSMSQIGG
jgi:cyclic pyranopterin phosphate synthase